MVALHVDVNFHRFLIHISGIKCSCSLYRSLNNAVPLPIASCACPNEILRSFLVASSLSKWSSNIVYLSSFVLTANSGSSSPPKSAGHAKLVIATFRWTLWEWHVAIPRGFWIADSSSYLRVPPQNGNVSDGVMKVSIAIRFCAAVSLDWYNA